MIDEMIQHVTMARELADGLEQIGNGQLKCFGKHLQGPQAGFLAALLKVRHEIFVKSSLLCKINLTPAPLSPQLPYPLPKLDADVPCHHPMVGLNSRPHPLYSVGNYSADPVALVSPLPGSGIAAFGDCNSRLGNERRRELTNQDVMRRRRGRTIACCVIILAACGPSAFAKDKPREVVTVIENESTTTPYNWEVDGHVSVSCYGSTCSGYYQPPASGTQQIQGAILKLQRSDSSVVVAQCVAKVEMLSSFILAMAAASDNDPNSPTVFRNCRIPAPNSAIEAEFDLHHSQVKLFMQKPGMDGSGKIITETYYVMGVLQPSSSLDPSVSVPNECVNRPSNEGLAACEARLHPPAIPGTLEAASTTNQPNLAAVSQPSQPVLHGSNSAYSGLDLQKIDQKLVELGSDAQELSAQWAIFQKDCPEPTTDEICLDDKRLVSLAIVGNTKSRIQLIDQKISLLDAGPQDAAAQQAEDESVNMRGDLTAAQRSSQELTASLEKSLEQLKSAREGR